MNERPHRFSFLKSNHRWTLGIGFPRLYLTLFVRRLDLLTDLLSQTLVL